MRLLKLFASILFLSLVEISIFSCGNDNSVTPVGSGTTIDSARYSWTVYHSPFPITRSDIWVRDTNDIFFFGGSLRYYSGIIDFFPVKEAAIVGGFDKNTGYIIGSTKGTNDSIMLIKKWNGVSFTEIPVSNNRSRQIMSCYFYKPDEMWLTTSEGKIYKFNGSAIINTPINVPGGDTCIIHKIYFDSTVQKLRAVFSIYDGFPNATHNIFEFNGSSWSTTSDLQIPGVYPSHFVNGYLINLDPGVIYYLKNKSFVRITGNNSEFQLLNIIDGAYLKNFFAEGYDSSYIRYMYNWNGVRWSKEQESVGGSLAVLNDRKFVVFNGSEYIAIGTKK